MSTPVSSNNDSQVPEIYAPRHVQGRALSSHWAAMAEPSMQADAGRSKTEEIEGEQYAPELTAAPEDAERRNEAENAKVIDEMEEALRALFIDLTHAPGKPAASFPQLGVAQAPSRASAASRQSGLLQSAMRLSLVIVFAVTVPYGLKTALDLLAWAGSQPKQIPAISAPSSRLAVEDQQPFALLMQKGLDFLDSGDISAARVAFRRLAAAGNAYAALALARTYDPDYLTAHNFLGMHGDRATARKLYQRAKELGSTEADRILAQMP
jgi:TPR repeat protein